MGSDTMTMFWVCESIFLKSNYKMPSSEIKIPNGILILINLKIDVILMEYFPVKFLSIKTT